MNRDESSSIPLEKYNVYKRYLIENLTKFIYIIIGMLYLFNVIIYLRLS